MSSSPVNPRPPSDLLAPQTSLDLKKKEINKQFDSLHTKLQEKQVSIISSLESKYAPSTGSEYDRLNTQLQKLYASKEGLEQTMRDPNLSKISHTLQQSLDSLNQDIKKLEEILNPEVSLVWNIESCKSAIDKVCQVKTDSKYNSTDQPLFSGVKIGTGIDDVSQPKSLAIAANNIYILDDRFVHFYNEKGQRMYKFPLPVFKDSNLDSYYLTYEGGYIYVAGDFRT